MGLDIGAALRDGTRRLVARSGLQLIGVFALVRLSSVVAADTVARANREFLASVPEAEPPFVAELAAGPTPLALPLGLGGALALSLAVALGAEAARIVAVRTFVSDRDDAIPPEFVTRRIVPATLNGFVGGVVVIVLVVVGLVFLVVPGIFLALVLFFVRQEIAVEDENFIDAMAGSWHLTGGNRVELFALGLVFVAAALLASAPGILLGVVDPALASLVGIAVSAVTATFGTAVAARAYDQLRTERAERRGEFAFDDVPV